MIPHRRIIAVMLRMKIVLAPAMCCATLILSLLTGCQHMDTYDGRVSPPLIETPSAELAETAKLKPTNTPTPSPEPTPTPTPEPRIVTDAEADDYFNNSVFVGDSITEGLAQYVRSQRKIEPTLGDAKFLTTINGMKLADCAGDRGDKTIYYSYKGAEKSADQCVDEMGVDKVFIMLGANDLGVGFSVAETIDRYHRTIDKILEAAPGVEIIILLNTPRNASSWLPDYIPNKNFGNPLIDEFVEAVKLMCEDRGLPYVDLNTALKGGDNALPEEYCRDGFDHINDAGAAVVVSTLHEFARSTLSSGTNTWGRSNHD